MAVGRISGPLLKSNLLRNGVDLAFETDLLYLDVNNNRIGIKLGLDGSNIPVLPQHELEINGTSKTTNLSVDTAAYIADITIIGNTISSPSSLNLLTTGSDTVIYQRQLDVQSISIYDNIVSTNESNANLEFRPNGTGIVEVFSDMNVDGNIHATGNITADGNIQLGSTNQTVPNDDTVTFNAEIASDIIPDQDDTYQLGTVDKRWSNLWVNTFTAENIDSDSLQVDGINLILRQGKIIYVATNGNDAKTGTHPNDPVASIKQAIAIASAGDSIHVYPGTYTEEFPIIVKPGVGIKGESLRSVKVIPTTATRYNDAFLLNGQSTIEDITVSGFYSGGNFYEVTNASTGSTTVNVGTSPFAHAYVSGGTVTIGSTDYALTNATYTHTTGVLVLTHATGTATVGNNVFVSNLTFSCNGGNRVFPDNGYAFRFATNFEVTSRSPYIKNVTVITEGTVTSASDPRGFNSGDAGKGVYVDGAYATASSIEAAMLFHSCTFIVPGVDAVTATNGARIEWLNSFTYFANRSIYAYDSNDGLRADGKTALRVDGVTGSYSASETVTYYDTDGTTVLATGTIETVDSDGKFYIDTKNTGWELPSERIGKTVAVNGDAQITSAVSKFGIGSLTLDGVGDYLSINVQDDFGFSTSDYTIEGWFYFNSVATQSILFDFRAGVGTDVAPVLLVAAGGQVQFYSYSASRILGAALSTGQWYHIAVSRSSGTTQLYVNGVSQGTPWVDSTDYGTSKPLTIGSRLDGTAEVSGYIDEIRISKGIARYTSNFTSTTIPFLSDDNTVLLLHFNDLSGSTDIVDDGVTGQDIRFSGGATATKTTLVDLSDFGAEIRMIGSASVYGNYGLVGDGPGVIMYAIGHNVAYIGNAGDVDNDPNTVIQANEVVATNNAKVYYSTVDHKGDFRVGDLFYIDQENGAIQFSNASFNIDTANGITITDGSNTTLIKGDKIETGNWRLSGNTLETLSGDANITAASNQINLLNDVDITGNLDVVGNVAISGNITIGDQSTDSISFAANIDSGMFPTVTATYDLGTESLRWRDLYTNRMVIDSIEINDNYIQTIDSNANLELRANGTGEVIVPSNNVTITNNLTVNGTTVLQDLTVIADLDITGNLDITGDVDLTGNITVSQTLDVGNTAQFENIKIDQNYITTTLSNSDLELRANGVGEILIPNNNVQIDTNLTVNGTIQAQDVTVINSITTNTLTTGDIVIDNNTITTTLTSSDLVLRAAGTGIILIDTNDVQLGQALTVSGTTDLQSTTITGTVTQTGSTVQTGDLDLTGNLIVNGFAQFSSQVQFENILVDDNIITTTLSNSDLELRASGTGTILVPSNDVVIENNLTVNGTIQAQDVTVINSITTDTLTTGDIVIDNNTITTTLTSSNLVLRANGAGEVHVDSNDVILGQALTVSGTTDLQSTTITGILTQTGSTVQSGDFDLTGNLIVNGFAQFSSQVQFENILVDDNIITTTVTNSDLELRASGTGTILIPSNDVVITQDLTVSNNIDASTVDVTTTVDATTFNISDITITNSEITTTASNANLELAAAGTGSVIANNDVVMNYGLEVLGETSLLNTVIVGTISHAGDNNQTGNLNITGNITITGDFSVSADAQFEEIQIRNNYITTTTTNSDLELRASGTGTILVPNNNVIIENDLTVNGIVTTPTLTVTTSVTSPLFTTGDIEIYDNVIETTITNSNLELRAAGTGVILIDTNDVQLGQALTVSGTTTLADTIVTGALIHSGFASQTGNYDLTGNLIVNGTLEVSSTVQLEEILIEDNFITTTSTNADLELRAAGTGRVVVPTNDVVFDQDVTITTGTLTTQNIINANSIQSSVFTTGDISITANSITTTQSNSDLILDASGTGVVNIPTSNVTITNDLTVSGLTTLDNTVIQGTLQHTGNYTHTGNATINGDYTVVGLFSINSQMQFENVLINDNYITTTASNSDLELRAAGTGEVLIPNNDVRILSSLTVDGTTNTQNIINTGFILSTSFETDDIKLQANVLETITETDLILRATGLGKVVRFTVADVVFDSNLTVDGTTTLQDTTINGTLTHVGNTNQTGALTVSDNITVTGHLIVSNYAQFEDVKIEQNFITTTVTNSNLELGANGTGLVIIPTNNVEFGLNLTVSGTITSGEIVNAGVITSDSFTTGDILINDNVVSTTNSNSDLTLRASGTGVVSIPNNNVIISNDLTVVGLSTLANVDITGTLDHIGSTTQTGDFSLTGNSQITGELDVAGASYLGNLIVQNNFVSVNPLNTNTDLVLDPSGTGKVIVSGADLVVTDGNIVATTSTVFSANIVNTGTVTSTTFNNGAIVITGNTIDASANLTLQAPINDVISIPSNDVVMQQALTVAGSTTLSNTTINGTLTHVGDYDQTGNSTINGNINVSGNIDIQGIFQFEEILIDDNFITTTTSNSNLEFRANGTGEILVPTNDVRFLQGLTVSGTLTVENLVSSSSLITSDRILTGNIVIEDNYITTTQSNSNLELRAAGTGSIDLGDISFNGSSITVSAGNDLNISLASGNIVNFDSTESIVLPSGTTLERPSPAIAGMLRFNTDIGDYEGYDGTSWSGLGGVYDADYNTKITAELTPGANDNIIRFYANGPLIATLDSTGLTTPRVEIDNILIENSTISSVTADTDITIEANGTGGVVIENFRIRGNTITNTVPNSNTEIIQTGTGYLKFGDTEGFVIPVGSSIQRPANPIVGVTRFNTTDSRVEVYDGQNWVSVAGSESGISRTDAENLAFEIVLSLG